MAKCHPMILMAATYKTYISIYSWVSPEERHKGRIYSIEVSERCSFTYLRENQAEWPLHRGGESKLAREPHTSLPSAWELGT